MNVFDFAMQMEDSGRDYYEGLADAASLPGLKTIFTLLADDERQHYEIFRALKAGNVLRQLPGTSTLDEVRDVFTTLAGAAAAPVPADTLAAYRHAMKLEADSFRLYEQAAANEPDAAVKQLLLKVAAEEHKHFTVLENVYNFVNAPNQQLAWGEFSNLDEFRQFGRDVDL